MWGITLYSENILNNVHEMDVQCKEFSIIEPFRAWLCRYQYNYAGHDRAAVMDDRARPLI